jgi:hypothetical protein
VLLQQLHQELLKLQDKTVNGSGTLTFEDGASLVQINNVVNVGISITKGLQPQYEIQIIPIGLLLLDLH